jgi:bacterioferritin (cytochrome b1)
MYGFAGYEDVQRPGISVAEAAALLRRWGYVEFELMRLLGGKLTSLPEMEVKYALGRHLWEDSQHAQALQERIEQLRSNGSVTTAAPDADLAILLEETIHAPDTAAFLEAVYRVWKPALVAAYRAYLQRTNPLADAATERLLRHILLDEETQIAWGQAALTHLSEHGEYDRAAAEAFAAEIRSLLEAVGLEGPAPKDQNRVERRRCVVPFEPSHRPARERKYALVCELPKQFEPGEDRLIRMMRRRMNEMDVAELCASSLYEIRDKPLSYYVDLARHCFDECRHAMFGHAGLVGAGYAIDHFPLKIGNANFFQSEEVIDRYLHLGVVIEQKKMAKTGKRAEWEYCRDEARHPQMTTFQDFDWADEVYHVHMSRRWVKEFFDGDWQRVQERCDAIERRWAEAVDLWDRDKAAC